MKKFYIISCIIILIGISIVCFLNKDDNDEKIFLTYEEVKKEISKYKNIDILQIKESNIELKYLDLDFDDDLDLMLSYRTGLSEGIFCIYEFDNGFINRFKENWAIEKMDYGNVVVSKALDNEYYEQRAYIINLIDGKVFNNWNAIIDSYNYKDISKPIETHGNYYVDDKGILHYFYKVDTLNENYDIVNTEYHNEIYKWDEKSFSFSQIFTMANVSSLQYSKSP